MIFWIFVLSHVLPPAESSLQFPQISASPVAQTCWTQWYDQDDPTDGGDAETLPELREAFPGRICERPLSLEVQTTEGAAAHTTGDVFFKSDCVYGFVCRNKDQVGQCFCQDYMVRFLCLCSSPPSPSSSPSPSPSSSPYADLLSLHKDVSDFEFTETTPNPQTSTGAVPVSWSFPTWTKKTIKTIITKPTRPFETTKTCSTRATRPTRPTSPVKTSVKTERPSRPSWPFYTPKQTYAVFSFPTRTLPSWSKPSTGPATIKTRPTFFTLATRTTRTYGTSGKPVRWTTRPYETSGKPVRWTTRPYETSGKPVRWTTRPYETSGKPVRWTTRPYQTSWKPVRQTTRPYETSGKPVTRLIRPFETTLKTFPTKIWPTRTSRTTRTSRPTKTTKHQSPVTWTFLSEESEENLYEPSSEPSISITERKNRSTIVTKPNTRSTIVTKPNTRSTIVTKPAAHTRPYDSERPLQTTFDNVLNMFRTLPEWIQTPPEPTADSPTFSTPEPETGRTFVPRPTFPPLDIRPVCWTMWFDRDDPSGQGDWETLSHLRQENPGKICPKPLEIDVQTVTGNPVEASAVIYKSDTTIGFVCRNKDQGKGQCSDYRVRFRCPHDFCYPPQQCWTDWFDHDDPKDTGDWEVLYVLRKQFPGRICESPLQIQARTTSGLPADSVGNQFATLSAAVGLICLNKDQSDGVKCNDFEVRFQCPPDFCNNNACWTRWFDRDDPAGSGDWESLFALRAEFPGQICNKPLEIQALTTCGNSVASTGNVITANDVSQGFICENDKQKWNPCEDFKVRFRCPPEFCTNKICWTRWFNRDTPEGTGDWELLSDLRKSFPNKICDTPLYIDVRATDSDKPITLTGQKHHIYSPTEGFACLNEDQGGCKCRDYKVRFGCPCDCASLKGTYDAKSS